MNDAIEVGNIKSDVASGSKGKQVMILDDDDVILSHKKLILLSSDWLEVIIAVG